jgi:hypothetical protein
MTYQKINDRPEPKEVDPEGFSNELQGDEEDGILSTRKVDAVTQSVRGVGGALSGVAKVAFGGSNQAEVNTPHQKTDLADKLDGQHLEGRVKMEAIEGRGGQPVAIPAIRQDGLGTTRIRVTNGANDAQLQQRFKSLADSQIQTPSGDVVNRHGFANEGYDIHNCSFCSGTGSIKETKIKTIPCPRCGGSGLSASQ